LVQHGMNPEESGEHPTTDRENTQNPVYCQIITSFSISQGYTWKCLVCCACSPI